MRVRFVPQFIEYEFPNFVLHRGHRGPRVNSLTSEKGDRTHGGISGRWEDSSDFAL